MRLVSRRRRFKQVVAAVLLAFYGAAFWSSGGFTALAQTVSPGAAAIHKVQAASWKPELGQPLFIAVLGSDTRVGPVDGGGGRCDAIHIVAINPQTKAGTVLNFPRDSYVNIPGFGSNKINSACSSGGAPLMVETLKQLTGIPIQYYVITEFSHFRQLILEFDGIDVNIPYNMADAPSGAFFPAGPRRLSAPEALAFTRNRKSTPNGDFSRTENQGTLIVASLAKFRAETGDPHRVFQYIRIARRNTKISVPLNELVRMALLAREIDPANVKSMNVPGGVGSAGSASIVRLAPGDIFSRVADDGVY